MENLADKFDLNNTKPFFLNLETFAKDLWSESNPGKPSANFDIKELSLSGNQVFSDNEHYKSKYRWIGEDDDARSDLDIPL